MSEDPRERLQELFRDIYAIVDALVDENAERKPPSLPSSILPSISRYLSLLFLLSLYFGFSHIYILTIRGDGDNFGCLDNRQCVPAFVQLMEALRQLPMHLAQVRRLATHRRKTTFIYLFCIFVCLLLYVFVFLFFVLFLFLYLSSSILSLSAYLFLNPLLY